MFDSYEWDYFVGFFREFARVRLTGNWTFSKKKKVQKRRREGDFATDKWILGHGFLERGDCGVKCCLISSHLDG